MMPGFGRRSPRRRSSPSSATSARCSARAECEPELAEAHRRGVRGVVGLDATAPWERHDVLVVGGGPGGAAAAYWLAKAGHDVAVVERKTFPREKTCGDGLTPRAVHQLQEMGLEPAIVAAGHHRYDGLRASPTASPSSWQWPEHPVFPSYGYVVRRRDLDRARRRARRRRRRRRCTRAPRRWRRSSRAGSSAARSSRTRRRARRGRSAPATSSSPTAPTAASAGRSAPTATASFPQGMAIRGYYESPLHADPWIESALDVRDRNGNIAARLRLDLPGRRRDHQRRHRAAVDVPGLEVGQHVAPHGRVRPHGAGLLGHLAGDGDRRSRPAAGCRWAARCRRTSGRRGCSSATPPARSTRSTARASTTPTRPAGMAAGLIDEALATGDGMALQRYPRAARRRVRPLLQGRPRLRQGDRQPGAARASSPRSACTAARSWSGCCGSWPTCCARTSSAPPKPSTRPSPSSPRVVPEPAGLERIGGRCSSLLGSTCPQFVSGLRRQPVPKQQRDVATA